MRLHLSKENFNLQNINRNYLDVWKLFFDLEKLNSITPIFGENIEFNESKLKIGSFLKFFSKAAKRTIYIKIVEISNPKKRKTLRIKLKTIGIIINNIPKIIEFKIVRVDNKTQLSILHIFQNDIEQEFLKNFQINIKEMIKKCKKYLEEQTNIENANNIS